MTKVPLFPYGQRISTYFLDDMTFRLTQYIKEQHRGRIVTDESALSDGRAIYPTYETTIQFENDEDATMFLLRWA